MGLKNHLWIKMNISYKNLLDETMKSMNDNIISKLELEYCLAESTHKSINSLKLNSETKIKSSQLKKFNMFVIQLASGKPLAYILNNQPFHNYSYYVDERVLIPRQETEIIIDEIIRQGDLIKKSGSSVSIIDAGSGSGCIGLTIAQERPEWKIILVEKSLAAISVLSKNLIDSKCTNCEILESDWLENCEHQSADIIISNPPYVKHDSKMLRKSVAFYEPDMALYSHNNGLEDMKKIIIQSKEVLKQDGFLFLENGYDQSGRVTRFLEKHYYGDIRVILDYNQIRRFTVSRNNKNG